jgi:hypothetical protein
MTKDITTKMKVQSLQGKITPEFIDYCNLKGVDLVKWYKWQLHLIWQHRKLSRDINERTGDVQSNLSNRQRVR